MRFFRHEISLARRQLYQIEQTEEVAKGRSATNKYKHNPANSYYLGVPAMCGTSQSIVQNRTIWPLMRNMGMTEKLALLTKIQEQLIKCRRTASETPDSKLALFLFRLADEVEAEAREADLIGE